MTTKLTKEQAITISGYTEILICDFADLQEDVEKRLRSFLHNETKRRPTIFVVVNFEVCSGAPVAYMSTRDGATRVPTD